jgi:gliding motility-associated-like protein
MVMFDNQSVGTVLTLPDYSELFSICFNVVGVIGQCSGLTISSSPTGVGFEDELGQPLALLADTGSVCVDYLPLNVIVEITDTTCLGTATMVVTATGGASDNNLYYDVLIERIDPLGPSSPGTITGSGSSYSLTPVGNFLNVPWTYSVCVTDSSGLGQTVCDTVVVFIQTLGAQISFIQQPTCNGYDNGIVEGVVLFGGVTVNNPGPQYSYTWSPNTVPSPTGILQDGVVNGNVYAGNYGLTVTDAISGCTAVGIGSLGQPTPVSQDMVMVMDASCTGVSNGSISFTAEGGTPFAGTQYQFAWEDPNGNPLSTPGQSNPSIINNASSGTYTVTVTDANGCTDTNTVTVNDLRSITLNQGILLNANCFGDSTGGINVSVTEIPFSSTPFTFTWSPTSPTFIQINNNQSSAYGNLPAGNYFVTAMDAVGCSDTMTITVGQPQELTLSQLGLQNPGCGQVNSGSISVVSQGGNGGPNYMYNWSNGGTGAQQGGLAAGDYTVTVTDTKGCKDSLMFTLNMPTAPPFTADSMPVRCGSDGSLTITSNAVNFQWASIPGGPIAGNNNSITGLDGGTYAVTITDAQSCTAIDTFTLSSVTPLSFADTSFVQPLCFGDNDGIIGITVQDGQAPYVNYQWNPTQLNSPTIFGLTAGVYVVTVTDNVGCTLTGSFTLAQPPQVVNTLSNIQNASCAGVCDGTTTIVANYATVPVTPGTFTYIWSDGVTNTANRTNLCAGVITVTSADNNGCGATSTVTIGEPPAVTGQASTTPTFCFGGMDGTATILGDGGNGVPYTYLWSNGATSATINNLSPMNYSVTITDAQGCEGVVGPITVSQPAEIMVVQDLNQSSDPECFGSEDGSIVVTVTGGNVGAVTYEWFDDMGVIGNSEGQIEDLGAGFYSVVVTDAQGCTGSLEDIVIQDPTPVQGIYEQPAALTCYGDVTALNVTSITGGSGGPYAFSVDNGALLEVPFPINLNGGEHYITYYDVNGCFHTDTLNIPEPAKIEVVFDPAEIEIELGDTTKQLKPLISGAAIESFVWSNPEFLHWPDTLQPYVYAFETQTFTLTVFDDNGCSGQGSVLVNVDPNRNVYIPNVFNPGVGRLNDHFNVYLGFGIERVNYMRIYDRWGELLYKRESFLPNNDNYADGWDGKFNGKYVNPGVYVYMIEVVFKDGRELLYRGDVTVVR